MKFKHLVSQDNPNGQRSEELLSEIRAEILIRMANYGDDPRPEAKAVMYSPTLCGSGGRGSKDWRRAQAQKCFQSAA